MRLVKHWPQLPQEAAGRPAKKVRSTCLDQALSNLLQIQCLLCFGLKACLTYSINSVTALSLVGRIHTRVKPGLTCFGLILYSAISLKYYLEHFVLVFVSA